MAGNAHLTLLSRLERHLAAHSFASVADETARASAWIQDELTAFARLTGCLSDLQEQRQECEDRAVQLRNQAQLQLTAGLPEHALPTIVAQCWWQQQAVRLRAALTPAHAIQSAWLQALAQLQTVIDRIDSDLAQVAAADTLQPRLRAVLARELLSHRFDGSAPPWVVDTEPWRERLPQWAAALAPGRTPPGPDFNQEIDHEFHRLFPEAAI